MKIIKRGQTKNERIWIGNCKQCKSIAEATENELTHITIDQREGTSFSWEKCPICDAGDKFSGYGGMIFYPKK